MEPFLRWAGGKRRKADEIISHMPPGLLDYVEPFTGAGGVFMRLLGEGRIRTALLGDRCWPLVNAWRYAVHSPDRLVDAASRIENTPIAYEAAKARFNAQLRKHTTTGDRAELAALFVYINAAGYGGMYRTNAAGQFNIKYGNRPQLAIHADRIRALSTALRGVEVRIVCADFELTMDQAPVSAVIYQDPPYLPDRPGGFTAYSGAFGEAEHRRLMRASVDAVKRGALCLHSNHDTPAVRRIYEGMTFHPVSAHRAIGNRHSAQRSARELIGVLR